jgi:hypothetical protein
MTYRSSPRDKTRCLLETVQYPKGSMTDLLVGAGCFVVTHVLGHFGGFGDHQRFKLPGGHCCAEDGLYLILSGLFIESRRLIGWREEGRKIPPLP